MPLASWLRSLQARLGQPPLNRGTRRRRPARPWGLERLEDRCVPASRFLAPVPTSSAPIGIAAPTSDPGFIWIAEPDRIARISVSDGSIRDVSRTIGMSPGAVTSEQNNLLLTNIDPQAGPQIVEVLPTDLVFSDSVPSLSIRGKQALAYDSDHHYVWFTAVDNQVGYLNLINNADIQTYPLPHRAADLAYDKVNNILWATSADVPGELYRVGLSASGRLDFSQILTIHGDGAKTPYQGLTLDKDGNVWVADKALIPNGPPFFGFREVYQLSGFAPDGQHITDLSIPTLPTSVVADASSSRLYLTFSNSIEMIQTAPGQTTTPGRTAVFPAPAGTSPGAITVSADGTLWFTDANAAAKQVGRFSTVNKNPVVNVVARQPLGGNLFGDPRAVFNEGDSAALDAIANLLPTLPNAPATKDPDDEDNAPGNLAYQWDFTGGPTTFGPVPPPLWTGLESRNTYSVKLTVTDPFGAASSKTLTLTVNNLPPVVTVTSDAPLFPGDPAFGTGGVARTDVTPTGDSAYAPARDSQGRIVTLIDSSDGGILRRFRPDGRPDGGFGVGGRVAVSLPFSLRGLAVQSDDKIIVAGTTGAGDFALARFNALGTLDTTFGPPGSNGIVTTDLNAGSIDITNSVAVQPGDNGILVAGVSCRSDLPNQFALVRYTRDGALDSGFGTGGAVLTHGSASRPLAANVLDSLDSSPLLRVQPDGKILVAGLSFGHSFIGEQVPRSLAVLRFSTDGTLDAGFGDVEPGAPTRRTGWFNDLDVSTLDPIDDPLSLTALAVGPSGEIVVGGTPGLVRLTKNGQLDTAFGPNHNGVLAFTPFVYAVHPTEASQSMFTRATPATLELLAAGLGYLAYPPGVAIDSNGRILVCGPGFTVVGLKPDGSLDPSFGADQTGTVSLAFDPTVYDARTSGLFLPSDGRVTLVGNDSRYDGTTGLYGSDIILAQFNTAPPHLLAGQVFSRTIHATDPSPIDQVSELIYDINWGDSSPADHVVRDPASVTDPASLPVSHTYSRASTTPYTVTITVTDRDGGQSVPYTFTVAVDALTTASLQGAVNGVLPQDPSTNLPAVTIQASADLPPNTVIAAVNALAQPATPTAVVLDLGAGAYTADTPLAPPSNVTLVLRGGTLEMGSPALTVQSGNVLVVNTVLRGAKNSPTILVAGGSLKLRNDSVQESTGYPQAAILLAGGSLDLGTAADPGGNVLTVNGAGALLVNLTAGLVPAEGNTFTVNGTAVYPLTATALTTSAATSTVGQKVTFAAAVATTQAGPGTPGGLVIFTDTASGALLGVALLVGGRASLTTAALTPGVHTVAARYSGDAVFFASAASVTQTVRYRFGGFQAPLQPDGAYKVGNPLSIRFQLTDYDGGAVTRPSAVKSLQVQAIDAQGNPVAAPFDPASSDGRGLQVAGGRFVFNWKTSGLAAGRYRIRLALDDGTLWTLDLWLS